MSTFLSITGPDMEVQGAYTLKEGDLAPDFDLPGTDGRRHGLSSFSLAPVLVVAWWCNHCPYVRAYEDRVIRFTKDHAARGVAVVAINSNETQHHPDDDFPSMVRRAQEKEYPFAYLRDDSQSAAAAYGAQCTPHFLVFDRERRLRYQGRFDDNKDHPHEVQQRFLGDAVAALLAGRAPPTPVTRAIGCSVKWMA